MRVEAWTPHWEWKKWAAACLVAAVLHGAVLYFTVRRWERADQVPMEVSELGASDLARIKKQWEKLEGPPVRVARPAEKEAPPDARYTSDRNVRVERESRARDALPSRQAGRARPAAPGTGLKRFALPLPMGAEGPAREREAEAGGGTTDSVLDESVPESGETVLNTRESVHFAFFQRMREAYAPVWTAETSRLRGTIKVAPGTYDSVYEAVYDSDGWFREAKLLQSSGIDAFDLAARVTLERIERFPNPPKALLDARGELHIPWVMRMRVTDSSGIQFLPPERIE